ncbi:MAG: hypothetical protein ACLTQI_01975 [Slackia sp.]
MSTSKGREQPYATKRRRSAVSGFHVADRLGSCAHGAGAYDCAHGPYRFRLWKLFEHRPGIYTDGSSILAMLPLFVFMCVLGKARIKLVKKHVFVLTSIAIAVQAASVIALGVVLLTGNPPEILSFGLSVIITLSSYLSIFYWLRRARGASSSSAVTIAFGSLLLSEPLIYLASLMPQGVACLAVGLLMLAQFICQKYARRRPLVENIHAETTPLGYFGFAERMIDGVALPFLPLICSCRLP